MLKVIVVGPTGRMGARVAEIVAASADARVVGLVGRPGEAGTTPLAELRDAGADALIDFSHPSAVAAHAAFCADQGVAWVLGTTGLGAAEQAAVDAAAARTVVFAATNFSLGVALLNDLAARAARILGLEADVEIVEHHHHHKVDAPSGTAMTLARAVASARAQDLDTSLRHGRAGLVGARVAGEIGMHALRLGDVVGHHEVHFAWPAEGLTLVHDARDRGVFAQGAVRAAHFAAARRAAGDVGLLGMVDLLAGA